MSTLLLKPERTQKIFYPESDEEPMAETDEHRDWMVALIEMLKEWFRDRQDVYVSGNIFVYYEKGRPSAVFSPDAFVVIGVPKKKRRTYKTWLEGGKVPDVVFEVSSESTSAEDEGSKKALCRRLGIKEYFLYDPDGEYLDPKLQGYQLVNGKYLSMPFERETGFYSEKLGLYLRLEGNNLRLVNPQTGQFLWTPEEVHAAYRAEAQSRQQAELEIARLQAELEAFRQK